MSINEMYQEVIIHHARSPKNYGHLKKVTHKAKGHNPMCGDNVEIELLIENDKIIDIAFSGDGCAISKASSSLMSEVIKGKTLSKAKELFTCFHSLLTDQTSFEELDSLGKLKVFSGVKQFPSRVKCATLAWHAVMAALNNKSTSVCTEQ